MTPEVEQALRRQLEEHYAAAAYRLSAQAEDLRVLGRTVHHLDAEGVERELRRVGEALAL